MNLWWVRQSYYGKNLSGLLSLYVIVLIQLKVWRKSLAGSWRSMLEEVANCSEIPQVSMISYLGILRFTLLC